LLHRVVRSNNPNVIGGDDDDDLLTGGEGAQRFIGGVGEDTITDYNETEGDTKMADCENFYLLKLNCKIKLSDQWIKNAFPHPLIILYSNMYSGAYYR
jgi:Ca2+-binding RTX toxin-like protein